jgi:mRNA interferase RelE/StbE
VKVVFRQSFERDLKKIKDRSMLDRVRQVIELIEAADNLQGMPNVKKLTGSKSFFRILLANTELVFFLTPTK